MTETFGCIAAAVSLADVVGQYAVSFYERLQTVKAAGRVVLSIKQDLEAFKNVIVLLASKTKVRAANRKALGQDFTEDERDMLVSLFGTLHWLP